MNKFFYAKASLILSWLNAKGYSGTLADAFNGYVQEYSGLSEGTFYDHLDAALDLSGYTGALEEKLNQMFISQTTKFDRRDAEREFFQNSSNDMFYVANNAVRDDDGNLILDDDGNQINA